MWKIWCSWMLMRWDWMTKKARKVSSITPCAPIFMFCVTDLFLHRKTTAISKSPYYTWLMCKIWWKVVDARIWWWKEIEWQKARITSSMTLCAPTKILWWNILLRRIIYDLCDCTPLHWGHPHQKFVALPVRKQRIGFDLN